MKLPVSVSNSGNNIIDFLPVFKMLNSELTAIGQSLELICVGGYVMQFHGYRGTVDVDAFFESNAAIDIAIRKVGDEFNINSPDELWLNNSVASKNPTPPTQYRELVHEYSHLVVMKVELKYLLGMKLESERVQDIHDVATILKDNNDKQPIELLAELKNMGFNIDIAVLLDAYERAYGMAWLEQFYIYNESELQELF
ncbi:MAG: hypothetical protein FWF79_10535 [Defluviitaleaceae bacterium]|nr:hypothetical protein [Defluviitaleaceae bacterium]